MGNPQGELIAALQNLKSMLEAPQAQLQSVTQQVAPEALAQAGGQLTEALGYIPLNPGTESYENVAGAIGGALGFADEAIAKWALVQEEATGAVAACQQAQAAVDAAIQHYSS